MDSRDTISVNTRTEKTPTSVRHQLSQPWESTHVQKSGLGAETKPRKDMDSIQKSDITVEQLLPQNSPITSPNPLLFETGKVSKQLLPSTKSDTMSSQLSTKNDRFSRVNSEDTSGSFQPEANCHVSDSSPSHNPFFDHASMDRGTANRVVAQKQLDCLVFGYIRENGVEGIVEVVLQDQNDDLFEKAKLRRSRLYQPRHLLGVPGVLTIGNKDKVTCKLTSKSWTFDNPEQTLPAPAFWNDPLPRNQKQLAFTAKLRSDISEDDDTFIRTEVSSPSDPAPVWFIIDLLPGQSPVSARTLGLKLDERTNCELRPHQSLENGTQRAAVYAGSQLVVSCECQRGLDAEAVWLHNGKVMDEQFDNVNIFPTSTGSRITLPQISKQLEGPLCCNLSFSSVCIDLEVRSQPAVSISTPRCIDNETHLANSSLVNLTCSMSSFDPNTADRGYMELLLNNNSTVAYDPNPVTSRSIDSGGRDVFTTNYTLISDEVPINEQSFLRCRWNSYFGTQYSSETLTYSGTCSAESATSAIPISATDRLNFTTPQLMPGEDDTVITIGIAVGLVPLVILLLVVAFLLFKFSTTQSRRRRGRNTLVHAKRQQLLRLLGDQEDINEHNSSEVLGTISRELGNDWNSAGRKLGLSPARLENVDHDYKEQEDKGYYMLVRWSRSPSLATRTRLCEAILKLSSRDRIIEALESENGRQTERDQGIRQNQGSNVPDGNPVIEYSSTVGNRQATERVNQETECPMVQVNADSDRRQTALAGSKEPTTSEEQGSSEESSCAKKQGHRSIIDITRTNWAEYK